MSHFILYTLLQMRMRTLERKKSNASRIQNGGSGYSSGYSSCSSRGSSSSPAEKNEFDDLISALRTGDVFGQNMDKFKIKRDRGGNSSGKGQQGKAVLRHSPPRVERADSFLRERTSSTVNCPNGLLLSANSTLRSK